jgi:hypothetical protein
MNPSINYNPANFFILINSGDKNSFTSVFPIKFFPALPNPSAISLIISNTA